MSHSVFHPLPHGTVITEGGAAIKEDSVDPRRQLRFPKRAVIWVGNGWFDRITCQTRSAWRLPKTYVGWAVGTQVSRRRGSQASYSSVKDLKEIMTVSNSFSNHMRSNEFPRQVECLHKVHKSISQLGRKTAQVLFVPLVLQRGLAPFSCRHYISIIVQSFLQLMYIICHYHLLLQSILIISTSLGKAVAYLFVSFKQISFYNFSWSPQMSI